MQRATLRYLVLLLILGAAALATWQLGRVGAPSQRVDEQPPSTTYYTVHTDVEGWYAATPDERAILSAYDLRLSALASALPYQIGSWSGQDLDPDPELEAAFANAELVLRRRYVDEAGQALWVRALGARGAPSFRLFEHTTRICYESAGWTTLERGIRRTPVAMGELPLLREVFTRGQSRHVVHTWYQWDGPSRDPAQGIVAWRLTAEANADPALADQVIQEFLSLLFVQVLPWRRF
jgi:hypothetical protein